MDTDDRQDLIGCSIVARKEIVGRCHQRCPRRVVVRPINWARRYVRILPRGGSHADTAAHARADDHDYRTGRHGEAERRCGLS